MVLNKYVIILIVSILLFIPIVIGKKIGEEGKKIVFMSPQYTDVIKGISIILIVWCHICKEIGIGGVQFIAAIGVSAFLICSGYGLECSFEKNGIKYYLRNRILRLIVPLLLVRIISGLYNGDLDIMSTFQRLTYKAPWFVRYIFISYMIFWLCKVLIANRNVSVKYEKYILGGTFVIWFLLESIFLFDPSAPSLQARQMISFPFGVWLAHNRKQVESFLKENRKRIVITMGIISLLATVFLELFLENRVPHLISNIFSLITIFPLSLCMLSVVYWLFRVVGREKCGILGIYSYELFLVHISFLSILRDRSIEGLFMFVLVTMILTVLIHRISNFIVRYIKKCFLM